MKKKSIMIAGICLAVIGAFLLNTFLENKHEAAAQTGGLRNTDYAQPVEKDNVLLAAFENTYQDREVILACEADVTNDGIDDLLVIYKEDKENHLVIVQGGEGGEYTYSDPVKAPVDNQKIQFKNIDDKDETEFIVSGEKNGAVGYAVYRMIGGVPTDLFGEGMEDCCN